MMVNMFYSLFLLLGLGLAFTRPPFLLCLILVGLSATVSGVYGVTLSKWLCYSIVLIFLGGMMVVFLYVSTMALNSKLKSPPMKSVIQMLTIFLVILLVSASSSQTNPALVNYESSVSQVFNSPSFTLVMLLVIFLLMALFAVVSLAQGFKGAILKSW